MKRIIIIVFVLFLFSSGQGLLAEVSEKSLNYERFLKNGFISSEFREVLLYQHFDRITFSDRRMYLRDVIKEFKRNIQNRQLLTVEDLNIDGAPEMWNSYLSLDPDSDGTLTEQELESVAIKVYDRVDENSDRHITLDEIQIFKTELIDHSQDSCSVGPMSPDSQLIVLKVLEGTAIASVATMGQDILTSAITVHVESPTKPIAVVAISKEPIIWQITGNTNAIQQLMVHSDSSNKQGYPSVGVTGLKKSVIQFLRNGCLPIYYNEALNNEYKELKVAIKKIVGREPDMVVEESLRFGRVSKDFEVSAFSLSSDKVQPISSRYTLVLGKKPPPQGYDPKRWMGLLSGYPDGVAEIDPQTVISKGKVEPYVVLPGSAGLARLEFQGDISYGGSVLRIMRNIPRLPGGERWKKRLTIVLADEVRFPEGDPGDSCVLREKTGEVLYEGFDCFEEPRMLH